ncbi:acetolactate synthase [Haematococcus lacustris]|uniref:Acetolactate synthase n=1 Tax=Haematococcus lacustris TaxID=44745 RepID=A0A6A0ADJ0_HAELA|nr:acetolactate synthase [Haematococcus lacustris]
MLGMHGTVYANYAIDQADLLVALGVRFDDRVTGKLEAFAQRARIVHIDIDTAEISKNKTAHVSVCADVKPSLQVLNKLITDSIAEDISQRIAPWVAEVARIRAEFPMRYPDRDDVIVPQYAIQVLGEETNGDAIITTGVGQHQMWAAQWYPYKTPRAWGTGGLGSMGFGLPSALGAAAAFDGRNGRPKKVVVDIDGDGSFLMNVQELATVFIEQLDTKVLLLNNQHLGMDEADIYPDFVAMARSFGVGARRVIKKDECRAAIREMLDTPGPFLLEVMVPHIEHVLPMIPGGASFKDIITQGDGADKY